MLQAAATRLSLLNLDAARQQRLTAGTWPQRWRAGRPGSLWRRARLLGCELTERALRFGLERSYRALARLAPDEERRVGLVELANEVRPRTWGDGRPGGVCGCLPVLR